MAGFPRTLHRHAARIVANNFKNSHIRIITYISVTVRTKNAEIRRHVIALKSCIIAHITVNDTRCRRSPRQWKRITPGINKWKEEERSGKPYAQRLTKKYSDLFIILRLHIFRKYTVIKYKNKKYCV